MTTRRDDYTDTKATRHFPQYGEPPGLTRKQARDWRRVNTWYINRGEEIEEAVLADPPACFTEKEWRTWLDTLPLDTFRLPDSPYTVQGEKPDERLARQQRSTRAAACSDCMLERQMRAEEAGVCHPPQYARTPRNCRQPAIGAEGCPDHGRYCMSSIRRALGTEGPDDDAAPGDETGRSDVLFEEELSDREVR